MHDLYNFLYGDCHFKVSNLRFAIAGCTKRSQVERLPQLVMEEPQRPRTCGAERSAGRKDRMLISSLT